MKNLQGVLVMAAGLTACFLQTACRNAPIVNKESPYINDIGLGQSFRIVLPEDHRTGYTWQLTNAGGQAYVQQTSSVWHGNEKGIEFNFSALASGQTTLTFVSRKYIDTSEVKSFIVKIQ